jgi:hypothetical protein
VITLVLNKVGFQMQCRKNRLRESQCGASCRFQMSLLWKQVFAELIKGNLQTNTFK